MFKFIKTITTTVSHVATCSKVSVEVSNALKGLGKGEMPAFSPNGKYSVDLLYHPVPDINAIAIGDFNNTEIGGGRTNIILITKEIVKCPTLLNAVLLHEEGHLELDAFPDKGLTDIEAEIMADTYAFEKGGDKAALALLGFLNLLYMNNHNIITTIARIDSLKAHLGM